MSSEPQKTIHYRFLMELEMKTKCTIYSNDKFPRFGHCVGYQYLGECTAPLKFISKLIQFLPP
jgi:hypothetical protein